VRDADSNWRIVYRIDSRAILIVEVFAKTTRQTPRRVIDACKKRLRDFDAATNEGGSGE